MISKRIVLALVMIGVTAIVVAVMGARVNWGSAVDAGQRLEGTWIYDVTGGAVTKGLHTYTAEGNAVVVGNPSPASETAGFGEWVRTGDHEFDLTYERFRFDAQGTFTGIGKVRAHLKLNNTLDQLTSKSQLDIYDLNGNLVRSVTSTQTGTRIKVEPLP